MVINKKESRKTGIVIFEIALLIFSSLAFSYLINLGFDNDINGANISENSDGKIKGLIELYKILIGFLISDKNIVSASSASTCLETKDGKICQQYLNSDCDNLCKTSCIPALVEQVSECEIGTCYDPIQGTCQAGSPKYICINQHGDWYNDRFGNNVQKCKLGCCVLGSNKEITTLSTEQQCNLKASLLGMSKQFMTNIRDALSCDAQSSNQPEGACVFENPNSNKKNCKLLKQVECNKLRGQFNLNQLCSKPELNTICTPQQRTDCYDNKVYWFDSCGNRENVYSIPKSLSYGSGNIINPNSVCVLNSDSSNRDKCGNCNYMLGTKCGAKGSENVGFGDFICKDLSCKDESGNKRENGESWCVYQSSIGLDSKENRAMDTPGSRHFRKSCIDGKIMTEPCTDYRNEICVEERVKKYEGGTLSTAACRTNLWQMCIAYNQGKDPGNPFSNVFPSGAGEAALTFDEAASGSSTSVTGNVVTGFASEDEEAQEEADAAKAAMAAKQAKVVALCNKNPDCFVKYVDIGGGKENQFRFALCAPKYAPGFDTKDYGETAETICGMGSQSCTAIFVKGVTDWECKANCECLSDVFAEKMNDLCISLGDCGTKVNYNGALTDNARIVQDKDAPIGDNNPSLTTAYLNLLKKYSTPIKDKYAKPETQKYQAILGVPDVSAPGNPGDPSNFGTEGMLIPGIAGVAGLAGLYYLPTMAGVLIVDEAGTGVAAGGMGGTGGALAGASGALAGAAIGFLVTSLLIKYTGIGGGLGEEVTYTLIGMGTAAGAIIGFNFAAGAGGLTAGGTAAGASAGAGGGLFGSLGAAAGPMAMMAAIAWILIAAIIIFIIVMKIMQVGKVQKVNVQFQCQPWQAPDGGSKCNECGKKGLPCSRYSCHQIGQSCEFLNEGTGNETCANVAPNDVSAPQIKILDNLLPLGYSSVVKANGVVVSGECLPAFSLASFGIGLNEPGQCKFDMDPSKSFDKMEYQFGGRNLYLVNHSMAFPVPSLESLGYPGLGANVTANITLYVKCKDANGNKNINPYGIGFCIKPGLDVSEPVIRFRTPLSEYIKYNSNSQNVSVFVNEPANCRWAINDSGYDFMVNNFTCKTEYNDATSLGWKCSTEFPISSDYSLFNVRCADQPWLAGINETKRNKNSQSYQFVLRRTGNELKIDSINVDGKTINGGNEPISVDVIAKTSGGYDGTATCSYSFDGINYVEFLSTFLSSHTQPFQFVKGNKQIWIKCNDFADNNAEKTASFKVDVDISPANITRIYESSSSLYVVTDENAQCWFVNSDDGTCSYSLSNATLMNGNLLTHNAQFNRNALYYIKCKDGFSNVNNKCDAIVRGGIIS